MRPRFWLGLTLMLIALVATPAARATLVDAPGAYLLPKAVWTDGTSTPLFHPLSRPMSSAGWSDARVATSMEQDSGNCKIRPALRYSNDGVTRDSAKEIVASYRTTEGTDYGTTYVDRPRG